MSTKHSKVIPAFIFLSMFVFLFSWNLFPFQEKTDQQQKPDPNRMQIFKRFTEC